MVGIEKEYCQIKLYFEPSFDKKTTGIFKVLPGHEISGDMTTASGSIMPLNFNDEETLEPSHHDEGNPLSLSNISFNEPSSPINNSSEQKGALEEEKQEASIKFRKSSTMRPGGIPKKNTSRLELLNQFQSS